MNTLNLVKFSKTQLKLYLLKAQYTHYNLNIPSNIQEMYQVILKISLKQVLWFLPSALVGSFVSEPNSVTLFVEPVHSAFEWQFGICACAVSTGKNLLRAVTFAKEFILMALLTRSSSVRH